MLIIWCRNVVSMEGCKKKVKKKKSSNKLLVNYLSTSLNQPSNDLFKLRQNIEISSRLRRNSVFYSYAFLFHEFPLYQRASFLSCSKVTCFLAFHDHFVLRLCRNYSLSLNPNNHRLLDFEKFEREMGTFRKIYRVIHYQWNFICCGKI